MKGEETHSILGMESASNKDARSGERFSYKKVCSLRVGLQQRDRALFEWAV